MRVGGEIRGCNCAQYEKELHVFSGWFVVDEGDEQDFGSTALFFDDAACT
jgi:hypothetical protein